MSDHPILFTGDSDMVRAILDGRKTQTRRVIKPQPWPELGDQPGKAWAAGFVDVPCPYGQPGDLLWVRETTTYGGYRGGLLVRYLADNAIERPERGLPTRYPNGSMSWKNTPLPNEVWGLYRDRYSYKNCPSIRMPKWACRLWLCVIDVWVERVRDISEEDARAEGLFAVEGDGGISGAGYKWSGTGYEGSRPGFFHTPNDAGRCNCSGRGATPAQCAFQEGWNSINAKRDYGWDVNPWVWAISFERKQVGE